MVTQKATAAGSGTVTHGQAAPGPERPGRRVTERAARSLPGVPMLVLAIVLLLAGVALLVLAGQEKGGAKTLLITLGILLLIADALVVPGLFAVVPGQARVVQRAGDPAGRQHRLAVPETAAISVTAAAPVRAAGGPA